MEIAGDGSYMIHDHPPWVCFACGAGSHKGHGPPMGMPLWLLGGRAQGGENWGDEFFRFYGFMGVKIKTIFRKNLAQAKAADGANCRLKDDGGFSKFLTIRRLGHDPGKDQA
jgi:hypothetical protein